MRERELKLAVGATFVMPDLADPSLGVAEVRDLPELELGSVYHDTADLRLARHGATLRYRIGEEGGPRWTLKLPVLGGDAAERDELDFDGGPGEIPERARQLVAAWVRRAHLAPAAALRTRRRRWLLTDGDGQPLAELAHDEVSVLDDDRIVARFRELELESRGPELAALRPIARRLLSAGATPAEPVPKAVRALGPRAAAAPDIVAPQPDPSASAGTAVRAAIAAAASRLVAHDAPARQGDAEAVHQMRVACRRLRSDLRTLAPLVDDDWATALGEELRWLGGLLGAVRDGDVQLAALERDAADLRPQIDPLLAALGARRDEARGELMAALAGARYLDLLEGLVTAAREPLLSDAAEGPAASVLPPLVEATWRRLRRRAKAIGPGAPDAAYHAVRIAAKRVRYAADAVAPFTRGRAARLEAVARRAARLQDRLGRLQDAIVLRAEVERVLREREGDGSFAFAAGRLVERTEAIRRDARDRYPKTWKRMRRAVKAWAPRR